MTTRDFLQISVMRQGKEAEGQAGLQGNQSQARQSKQSQQPVEHLRGMWI